jgi:hypothetical protein
MPMVGREHAPKARGVSHEYCRGMTLVPSGALRFGLRALRQRVERWDIPRCPRCPKCPILDVPLSRTVRRGAEIPHHDASFAILIIPTESGAKLMELTIRCQRCGLTVQRLVDRGPIEIEAIAYVNTCQIAPERAAFDFDCPELQAAIKKSQA